jgi:hypothetical protein
MVVRRAVSGEGDEHGRRNAAEPEGRTFGAAESRKEKAAGRSGFASLAFSIIRFSLCPLPSTISF